MDFLDWYGNPLVQWNILRGLKGRYLTIKPSCDKPLTRYNRVTAPGDILTHIRRWEVREDHKMYMDVTTWKDLPLFSYSIRDRFHQKAEFNEEVEENIADIDFLIDIDATKDSDGNKMDWQDTHKRALDCMEWLNKQQLSYAVWNSSNNGFQFLISGKNYIRTPLKNRIDLYKQIISELPLDIKPDSTVYDHRRICKLPYSLCNGTVILPLTDEQLQEWTPQLCIPENVLKTIKIYNRGWMVR